MSPVVWRLLGGPGWSSPGVAATLIFQIEMLNECKRMKMVFWIGQHLSPNHQPSNSPRNESAEKSWQIVLRAPETLAASFPSTLMKYFLISVNFVP